MTNTGTIPSGASSTKPKIPIMITIENSATTTIPKNLLGRDFQGQTAGDPAKHLAQILLAGAGAAAGREVPARPVGHAGAPGPAPAGRDQGRSGQAPAQAPGGTQKKIDRPPENRSG